MNDYTYSSGVESIDHAALLITLGYDLKDCKIVNHINMNTGNHAPRKINATWTFSKNSRYCKEAGSVSNVLRKFAFPAKNERAVNVYQLAKIAAHNYQVLKSVLLEHKPLQQIQGVNYTIFKNSNGNQVINDCIMGLSSCDISSIAIAGAMGCSIMGYIYDNDRLRVTLSPNKEGITVKMIEDLKNDPELHNAKNYATLPVLIAMFINRKWLMDTIHNRNSSIMISRGDRLVMFDKNTCDNLKEKALHFINQ